MITSNFKKFLMLLLASQGTSSALSMVPVKTPTGSTKYIAPSFSAFPGEPAMFFTTSMSDYGIHVGSGSTPPAESDYALEQPITSGLTATSPSITVNYDAAGNPYKDILLTLSNTTSSDITITEVGYYVRMVYWDTQGVTTNNKMAFMIDRTLLDSPLTIPANGAGVLKYQLKTIIS